MVKVLLVDDDPMLCQSLAMILGSAEDIDVVGTGHDGSEVLDLVHQHDPDVVLMDVRMPQMDGLAATQQLQTLARPPAVLVLTTFALDDVARRAVQAGAAGFLLKTVNPHELVDKVRAVARGEGVVSSEMVPSMFTALRSSGPDPAAADAVGRLSERELEVTRLAARGHTNAEIGRELYISETTVKTHLTAAQNKMDVRSRVEVAVLVALAGQLT